MDPAAGAEAWPSGDEARQRRDAGQDAVADVEGEEDRLTGARGRTGSAPISRNESYDVVPRHVEGEDANEDQGGPEQQEQGQLHRCGLLGADRVRLKAEPKTPCGRRTSPAEPDMLIEEAHRAAPLIL